MALALGELLVIIRPRPLRVGNGVAGPFVKRLAEEFGTGPTHVDPFAPTAGLLRRSSAGEALYPAGIRETFPFGAESGDQTRDHHFSGNGQGIE